MAAVSALGGATAAAGLLLVVAGLLGLSPRVAAKGRRLTRFAERAFASRRHRVRLGVTAVAPLLVLLVTGWPVAALLAGAATAGLPALLGARQRAEREIARLEALGAWTRRLSDMLGAGSGIEQALELSLRSAPEPIRPEVSALVGRVRARRPVEVALRVFADDIDDPTGDLVAAALILAAHRRGRGLAQVLTALAATVDAEVSMRRKVEADRAQPRTTARYVVWITVAVAGGLVLLNRPYVEPFGSSTGQAVLLAVGALFAGAFLWMHRLTSTGPPRRFLSGGSSPSSEAPIRPAVPAGRYA
jgi:Flp pilus assembly protein TadB